VLHTRVSTMCLQHLCSDASANDVVASVCCSMNVIVLLHVELPD